MYLISKKKIKNKNNDFPEFEGFFMGSKGRVYKMNGYSVKNICVLEKKLYKDIVSDQVMKKYNKLIEYLTELFVSDDDTGGAMREALNQIEKFRLMIKNKYRKLLKQKELELMSKQLSKLQKAANIRLIEIHNSYMEQLNNRRSK